jgi:hypothetical protein
MAIINLSIKFLCSCVWWPYIQSVCWCCRCVGPVRKIANIWCSTTLFIRKSCCLWDNVYLHGTTTQVTDDNLIWRMLFAWWRTKAIDIESEYIILITFPWQQWLCKLVLRLYPHCLSCSALSIIFPVKHKLLQVIWCMWHESIIVSLHGLQIYCALSVAKPRAC